MRLLRSRSGELPGSRRSSTSPSGSGNDVLRPSAAGARAAGHRRCARRGGSGPRTRDRGQWSGGDRQDERARTGSGSGARTQLRGGERRGSDLEVAYAWGIVRQLLEPRLRGMSAAARSRTLTGAAALAAPVVLPGPSMPAVEADASFGVLHGVYWLVAGLAAERPQLLIVTAPYCRSRTRYARKWEYRCRASYRCPDAGRRRLRLRPESNERRGRESSSCRCRCALTGGIIATSAVGQGTGGTVGPAAVGTKTFEVRMKESNIGFNCVASKPRKCLRQRPRIANVFAGNGAVYDGSTRVGTAGFTAIASKVKRPSLDVFWRPSCSRTRLTRSR